MGCSFKVDTFTYASLSSYVTAQMKTIETIDLENEDNQNILIEALLNPKD